MTSADYSAFFFSSRRRHTRLVSDWSSDVCSSDLVDQYRSSARLVAWLVRRYGIPVDEIGRASCRERVDISVGAGSGKKKNSERREGRRQKEKLHKRHGVTCLLRVGHLALRAAGLR